MATIITINSADKLEPDSRNNINSNFQAVNNELVTKLPLAGGTMSGDMNMGGYKITNLPAPVNSADAARKQDTVPAAGSITETMIATGAVTNTKHGPASVSSDKISHDNTARKHWLWFTGLGGTAGGGLYLDFGKLTMSVGFGPKIGRGFCITGFSTRGSGGVTNGFASYAYSTSDAARHFSSTDILVVLNSGTDVVEVMKNASLTGLQQVTHGGTSENLIVGIEIELDD